MQHTKRLAGSSTAQRSCLPSRCCQQPLRTRYPRDLLPALLLPVLLLHVLLVLLLRRHQSLGDKERACCSCCPLLLQPASLPAHSCSNAPASVAGADAAAAGAWLSATRQLRQHHCSLLLA
jgi:hypothetical protein